MTDLKRYLQTVWAIFRKDVQVEWRGRQGVPVMLIFSLLVVFPVQFHPAAYPATAIRAGFRTALGNAGVCRPPWG